MASSKHLCWIKEDELTSKVAKRFVEFCEEDVARREHAPNFDAKIYEDAVRLIVDHLEDRPGNPRIEEDNA